MSTRESRVILLTGAAIRVGAAVARDLHQRGYRLVVHYRSSAAEALALKRELEGEGAPGTVELVVGDLNEPDTPEKIVEAALERWGRLDGLINNASLFYPTAIGEVSPAQWEELMGVNLKAPFFLTQAAAEALREAHGAVINVVDIYAERPLKGFSVYSIAKAGLAMMTKSMARELAPQVRVNAIAPGAILWPDEGTPEASQRAIIKRTALKRKGEPEDIASAVRYLLEEGTYVTGQILTIDGGRTLTP